MKFDVYYTCDTKDGKRGPGVKPHLMEWVDIMLLCQSPIVTDNARKAAEAKAAGNKEEYEKWKKELPTVCFMGRTIKTRAKKYMKPTGLVMVDIDHVENPAQAISTLIERMKEANIFEGLLYAGHTPSLEGVRLVLKVSPSMTTIEDNLKDLNDRLHFDEFGKFDSACSNLDRLSFLVPAKYIYYCSVDMMNEEEFDWDNIPIQNPYLESLPLTPPDGRRTGEGELFSSAETIDNFTEEEEKEFEAYEYKGTLVRTIIEKWVEVQGKPGKGEVHNYYNDMVKNFRNIVSNNKRALLYLLPRFGHTAEECWSSIVSICRVNTLSSLPKPFYFFLKDNGFYKQGVANQGSLAVYMMSDQPVTDEKEMPWLPPVFREFIKMTPKDFRPSMVNALLPIMGTLESYLQAPYYYDARMHTPSFFSVIYAPAGTGKGFVERVKDVLFEKIKMRDYVQEARNHIYLNDMARKGANDKAPENPHTSLREIPPKNSEAEFLERQRDNHGYHMFTYAAEMDSWAKGARAAGGSKDDMIRIAWDNGEYGQQFKSAGTFNGTVNLFWNVLITGTVQQLLNYFKNVENGLITRCSFTSIDNQEFAEAPIWKNLSKKDLSVIRKFTDRCDNRSYNEPITLLPEDVDTTSAENFDKAVDWRFTFRKKQTVDMKWLRPTIEKFLNQQLTKAALDLDKARDVFRRRVAVRGFRLGLICYGLWDKPRESDLKKCIPFIEWWMEQDIEGSMKLWGQRYNDEAQDSPNLYNRNIFNELPQTFSKNDVYAVCVRQGIKSPVRKVISNWKKFGYIEKTGDNEYTKTKKK